MVTSECRMWLGIPSTFTVGMCTAMAQRPKPWMLLLLPFRSDICAHGRKERCSWCGEFPSLRQIWNKSYRHCRRTSASQGNQRLNLPAHAQVRQEAYTSRRSGAMEVSSALPNCFHLGSHPFMHGIPMLTNFTDSRQLPGSERWIFPPAIKVVLHSAFLPINAVSNLHAHWPSSVLYVQDRVTMHYYIESFPPHVHTFCHTPEAEPSFHFTQDETAFRRDVAGSIEETNERDPAPAMVPAP
jgi:hypothetical protein